MTEDETFWEILTSTVMPLKHDKVKPEQKKLKVKRKTPEVHPTVLDLHGNSIQCAYEKTLSFIDKHLNLNTNYIVIITGKGKNNSGQIRREIEGWLKTDKFKRNIKDYAWLNGNGAIRLVLKKQEGK